MTLKVNETRYLSLQLLNLTSSVGIVGVHCKEGSFTNALLPRGMIYESNVATVMSSLQPTKAETCPLLDMKGQSAILKGMPWLDCFELEHFRDISPVQPLTH